MRTGDVLGTAARNGPAGPGGLEERRRSASLRLYGLDRAVVAPCAAAGSGPPPADALTAAERSELDEIVTLTRTLLDTEGAGVNLLVDDVQVTVACTGPVVTPLDRDLSMCSVVLGRDDPSGLVEIRDLREDPDLAGNPFVDGRRATLRFYAAAPLTGKHGLALGSLCVWDSRSRALDDLQRGTLRQFGRAVVNLLDERRRLLVPDRRGVLRPGGSAARASGGPTAR